MHWKSFLRRNQDERALDEEFAFHLEARRQDNIARGMDPAQAARAARRSMDGIDRHKEACRDTRGPAESLDRAIRVLRHALRRLAASPGFSFVAAATLAIGIGASTAVFTLVNGILLAPLPYRDPGQLVAVTQNVKFGGQWHRGLPVSAAHVREWRQNSQSLDSIALIGGDRRYLASQGGSPVPVYQTNVTVGFFRMLGVEPVLGRTFATGEDTPGKDNVAILSYEFWRDRFQSDPSVIGSKLPLAGGESPEVIGVLPAGFSFLRGNDLNLAYQLPRRADFWRPLALERGQFNPVAEFNHLAVARVRSGVAAPAAVEEWTRLSRGLARSAERDFDVTVNAVTLRESIWGGVSQPLLLLSAAVGAVLLICCLNVANLMLSRMLGRLHEFALRASLGAGRGRLILEMLAEGVILSFAGGFAGLLGARALVRALPRWTSIGLPSSANLDFDWRVSTFAFALCVLAAMLASLFPALRFSQADPQDAMRQSGTGRGVAGSRRANHLRAVLVGAEVALCVVLLVSAGLLLRSFDRLLRVEPGFEAARVVMFDAQLPVDRYAKPEQRLAVWRELLVRLAALPGVTGVGAANKLPMSPESNVNGVFAEGQPRKSSFELPMANYRAATPGYFDAAGIRLHAGRVYTDSKADHTAVVVSKNLADRIWPGQDPLGRRFQRNGEGEWLTVVGVSADVKQAGLDSAAPMMVYRGERGTGGLTVVVRTSLAPAAFHRVVREEVARIDSAIMLDGVRTMEELVSATTARRRWQTLLLSLFAGVAAMLAGLGIWGVVSYTVGQRRNEIGVRMALGAKTGNVVGLVVRQALRPIAAGAAVGVACAMAASRLLESLLFGIEPLDFPSYAGAALLLVIVAAAACAIPARNAARINPVDSLRAG